MSHSESLSDRLNRLAQQKQREQNAEQQVKLTQEVVTKFIYENSRGEYNHLLSLLDPKITEVNAGLKGIPLFEHPVNAQYVKQQNVAVFFTFDQIGANFGPIRLRISFGREPQGFYLDFDTRGGPEPERYELTPAMETSPDRIVWIGDLAPLPNGISSEKLVEFAIEHLTEYYLSNL
jgi:hypothetical protein